MDFTTRSEMILGKENLDLLAMKSVAVFGLGGVGGAAVEALARVGIGTFYLVDPDSFNRSNINRQLLATENTLGKKKVDVARERILSINPNANVFTYPVFYLPHQDTALDFLKFDYVIDAIDTVTAKVDIIRRCKENGIGIVSCMGCGNRIDPSKLRVEDIYRTHDDPLAKVIRQKCRQMGIESLTVVYSVEEPLTPLFKIQSDSATRRDVPGSTPFVPPVAGYLLAQTAVMNMLKFDPNNRK